MTTPRAPISGGEELEQNADDFLETQDVDLLTRWDRHLSFWDSRLASGVDPSLRTTLEHEGGEARVLTRGKEIVAGINFAAQDPLALARHPLVRAAAVDAAERWGVHSAGPLPLQGGTPPLATLEERIAEVLCCGESTIFPSGWAAGYGTVRALVRPTDHVIIGDDVGPGLREGAAAATSNLHRQLRCTSRVVASRLSRIRAKDAHAGILVVTQTLSHTDSTVADIVALRNHCRAWNANLLVDVTNDFGAVGDGGLGFLGAQAMVGEVDIVVGSLARTFATNGGFAAAAHSGIRQALAVFATTLACSTTISPIQAAVALAAFDIVRSAEGARRRGRLMDNVLRLRVGLAARAFTIVGQPSGIVPVIFADNAEARSMTREVFNCGALVNLVEHPAALRTAPRWCLLPTADHSSEQIDQFIDIAVAAREDINSSSS
jgi:glycine C-acetyltransferase